MLISTITSIRASLFVTWLLCKEFQNQQGTVQLSSSKSEPTWGSQKVIRRIIRNQTQLGKKEETKEQTSMFPFPSLLRGWSGFVPPMDPTKTICLTPAALAVHRSKLTKIRHFILLNKTNTSNKRGWTYQHLFGSSGQSNQPTHKEKDNPSWNFEGFTSYFFQLPVQGIVHHRKWTQVFHL